MKKVLTAVVAGFSLAGCAPLQVMELVAIGASQTVAPPMTFRSDHEILPVQDKQVYPVRFKPEPAQRRHKCDAQGIVVDYARDWDIVDESTGEVIRKAEPNKIYDQAILLYKLFCENEEPKAALRTTDRLAVAFFLKKKRLLNNEFVSTRDYFNLSENARPRWIVQVIQTIQEEAPTNPAAQDFLDNVEIGEDGLPVKPEISEDNPKE